MQQQSVHVEGEERSRGAPAIVVCEHASPAIPDPLADLGLAPASRLSHVVWDPGALNVARQVARELGAPLVHGGLSRLVYDLNRPPDAPDAMPARSERHEVPGNADLPASERLRRVRDIYLPFHATLRRLIAEALARGEHPAIVTIHSFTPIFNGRPREEEIGLIHDADSTLARRLAGRLPVHLPLRIDLNRPYSAADGVTHTLRLHALPYGLENVMIEIRNDLVASEADAERIGSALAAALGEAIAAWRPEKGPGKGKDPETRAMGG